MIRATVVTIYESADGLRFQVHRTEDGKTVADVTEQFEVRELTCQDNDAEQVEGWHVGQRKPAPPPSPCMHLSTSMFGDGLATCFECGAEIDEQRQRRQGVEL